MTTNTPSTDTDTDTGADQCGYEKDDGEPCQLPASQDDGHCHHHTEQELSPQSKLTVGRRENIAQMIEQGHSMKASARANGIHPATLFNWLSQGEADKKAGSPDTPHAELFDRIVRARGESERSYVDTLRAIAEDNDDAAMLMTMLKQRHADSWGEANASEQKAGVNVYLDTERTHEIDPDTLEVIDADGGPVDTDTDTDEATPEIGSAETNGGDD